jgi:dolichol kinase
MSGLLLLLELTWRNFLHNQFAQLCCVGVIFFPVQDFWFFYRQLKVKRVSPFVGKFAKCFTSQSRKKKKNTLQVICESYIFFIFLLIPNLASCVIIQLLVEDVVAG